MSRRKGGRRPLTACERLRSSFRRRERAKPSCPTSCVSFSAGTVRSTGTARTGGYAFPAMHRMILIYRREQSAGVQTHCPVALSILSSDPGKMTFSPNKSEHFLRYYALRQYLNPPGVPRDAVFSREEQKSSHQRQGKTQISPAFVLPF